MIDPNTTKGSKQESLENYSPPTIHEIGDAVELTQGNIPGDDIDPGNPPVLADEVSFV